MDLIFINGEAMLTSIDKSIRYRKIVPMESQTADSLYKAVDEVLREYNKAGYTVSDLHIDGQFETVMNEIIDQIPGVKNVDPAPPGAHVPEAERNNRTIAERVRAAYHNLPYKCIPKPVVVALAKRAVMQLNLFPAKGGVSSHLSPHVLVKQRVVDYDRDCKFCTGAYVQGNVNALPRPEQHERLHH